MTEYLFCLYNFVDKLPSCQNWVQCWISDYATPGFHFLFRLSYEHNMQQQIQELNEKLKLKEKIPMSVNFWEFSLEEANWRKTV